MNECELVQDLLIGYNDKTLNEFSKKIVEEHLKQCEICKKMLEEINDDKKINENSKEIDYLKKIRKKDNKKSLFIIILIILSVFIIGINFVVFVNYCNEAGKIEIFLDDNISEEQIEIIKKQIKLQDENAIIIYNSKNVALEKFKEKLDDNSKNLLKGYENENNIFPASIEVTSKIDKTQNIIQVIENLDGIKKIVSQLENNPYLLFFYKIIK